MTLTPPALAREPAHSTQDAELPEDFDRIAVVVDWLDACRKRDLDTLLDLYAEEARLEMQMRRRENSSAAGLNWIPTGGRGWTVRRRLPSTSTLSPPSSTASCSTIAATKASPYASISASTNSGKIMQTRCEPSGPIS